MTFEATQTIIRVGTSDGVTIPAKDLKAMGAKTGDKLHLQYSLVREKSQDKLADDYAAFKEQYGETLKNLADR